ncbi:MAG TPA: sulfite exporter TauE/SafE family protein [Planctomycetota bacterium]|nr:sulfite exporter TauE/SafE family protein [Planctomycetota bacterium]
MSPAELVGLVSSAAAAGLINAVAGGGTLLTFPTLLVFGTAPLVANATSTLALVIGTFGGVFGYRNQLAAVRPWLWRLLPPSLVGGWLGSWLLKNTSDHVFAKLVPFLILFATILFLAQGVIKRWTGKSPAEPTSPAARTVVGAVLFQFGVAVYGGYFGAGIGILMLASLGLIGLSDIHQMNALKTVLGSLINLVASIVFILAGLIDWPRAGIMTVGALVGYLVGSHYSQRIPQARVRQIVTAIGLLIAAVSFWKEFLR